MFVLAFSLAAVWSKVWPVLIGILFFGLIILIHEIGHFAFAKLFKVRVIEFAVGMGPTLFKFGKGETKYAVRAFPIGGFCSMEGEDENEAEPSDRSYNSKKPWQRFLIISAGAIFNLTLGLILAGVLLSQQNLIGTTEINYFQENAVSSEWLRPRDKIERINGLRLYTYTDVFYALTRGDNTSFTFDVIREGEKLRLEGVQFEMTDYEGKPVVIYDFVLVGVEKTVPNMFKNMFLDTFSMARIVRLSLTDLITGKYGLKELSGPIGTMEIIASAATEAAAGMGLGMIFTIMAFITINVGVFNLLPLPALDGGRLLFIALEGIRRKPVLPKYEKYVHAGGLIALLAFMAVVTLKDVIYLFK